MDRVRVGSTFRAIRLELRLRQLDVAGRAGVSQQTVSAVEAGRWNGMSVDVLEAIAEALEADAQLSLRWRGPLLPRLLDRRHARLQGAVAEWLASHGWEVRVEESFNHFGERGSVDILAWRADVRALLVIEIKSELVDVQDTIRALGMKARLMPDLMRAARGWEPLHVAAVLVLPEVSLQRRVVAAQPALSIALPERNVAIRRWLHCPAGNLRGIWFFANTSRGGDKSADRTTRRVRRPSRGV